MCSASAGIYFFSCPFFPFLFFFLRSATLPGNTDSHFTHDLTLWLRIAVTVQLGFSLTGDMLQLGNRGQLSPCSQNQTHKRSMEHFVCSPPFKTAEQGEEVGTGVQWAKIHFLRSCYCVVQEVYIQKLMSWAEQNLFQTGPVSL